jgi:RHS repeat-associated protein
MSCDLTVNGYQPTADFIVDLAGAQMTELAVDEGGAVVAQHTNVSAAGMLIATYDNAGNLPAGTSGYTGLHFYLNDALGSRRVQTDPSGVVEQTCASLPFGDQLACSMSTTAPTEHHFTGKERDPESGLDYMFARYYSSNTGRFMSPDPKAASGHAADPQSWNRYAYTDNNPLMFIDPNGLEKFLVIYIQQPVPGKDTSHITQGFTEKVGHSFIGLKDTDNNKEVKIGFYPNPKHGGVETLEKNYVPGYIKNNDVHGYNVSYSIKISDDQFKKLVDAAYRSALAPSYYGLYRFNCTDWVIGMARLIGVELPHKKGGDADPRRCRHEILIHNKRHRMCTAARKESARLAYRVAIPRHSFRSRKAFSTKCRNL